MLMKNTPFSHPCKAITQVSHTLLAASEFKVCLTFTVSHPTNTVHVPAGRDTCDQPAGDRSVGAADLQIQDDDRTATCQEPAQHRQVQQGL